MTEETFNRETSFGWLINALASQTSKIFDAELKKHGLTIALWPTLMCLWEEEGVTQRQIADKAKVENSTTTRTLDKLEKLGLVERRPDPASRRSFHIYLTKKGKELEKVLSPIPLHLNNKVLSPLTDSERKELTRSLQIVLKNI